MTTPTRRRFWSGLAVRIYLVGLAQFALVAAGLVAVHALGRPRVVDDAAFTRETLTELVARHEPTPDGWSTAQLPPEKLDSLVAAIVAFEMPIERLEAKFKLGQNRSQADRDGTLAGLERSDSPDAAALAAFMRAHFQP